MSFCAIICEELIIYCINQGRYQRSQNARRTMNGHQIVFRNPNEFHEILEPVGQINFQFFFINVLHAGFLCEETPIIN